MIDEAERLTDEALAALEKRIARIYREARDALEAQAQEYFRKFLVNKLHSIVCVRIHLRILHGNVEPSRDCKAKSDYTFRLWQDH